MGVSTQANLPGVSDSSEFFRSSRSHGRFRLRSFRLFFRLRSRFSSGEETLDDVKRYRDQKDRDCRGSNHSANHSRAEHTPCDSTGTAGKPKRQKAEDESKGSHQDRAETKAGAFERSIEERFAFFVFIFRELDDEDGVLRSQTNQHY